MTLFEFLKTALAERRQTIPQFARTCGVSGQLAYKWLAEDPEQRIVPSPTSCEKIASALGADSDYVKRLPLPSTRTRRSRPRSYKTRADFRVACLPGCNRQLR